jgi:hypothetical protein
MHANEVGSATPRADRAQREMTRQLVATKVGLVRTGITGVSERSECLTSTTAGGIDVTGT